MEQTAIMPQKRVRTIPPTIQPVNVHSTQYTRKRVAAYCRVSTKQEEQLIIRNASIAKMAGSLPESMQTRESQAQAPESVMNSTK